MFGTTTAQDALKEMNNINAILRGNQKTQHLKDDVVNELQQTMIVLAEEIADYYALIKVNRMRKEIERE